MATETTITKQQAFEMFGTGYRLAKELGLTSQAVYRWPDGPIPQKHALRIRYELKPELFEGAA